MTRELGTLFILLALAGCDPSFGVIVTVPLPRPIAIACAESTFDSIAHPRRVNPINPQGPPVRGMAFVNGRPYEELEQHQYKDGTAALETSVWRWGPNGGRFSNLEANTVGRVLSATLTRVRDACGGSAVPGAPPYSVKRKPF